MQILTVIGVRPQFIKAAVVSQAFRNDGRISEVILHTGQHYDPRLSDIFFQELGIPTPTYQLCIGSNTPGAQLGRMLDGIDKVLQVDHPDRVLVYGDTNSTLAGALAAAKLGIPVAHVEAGLRSHNRHMAEEINRVLTDHLSALLLTPTAEAAQNLTQEGISASRIAVIGDVMEEAVRYYGKRAARESHILTDMSLSPGKYCLATIHRAENTDTLDRLQVIIDGLVQGTAPYPVIVPLHPRTRQRLHAFGLYEKAAMALRFIEPIGYRDMLALEKHARLILTDSGGVQKEAFYQEVPCVILRDDTEWPELLSSGWGRLVVPTDTKAVVVGIAAALSSARPSYPAPTLAGDKSASRQLISALLAEQPSARLRPSRGE